MVCIDFYFPRFVFFSDICGIKMAVRCMVCCSVAGGEQYGEVSLLLVVHVGPHLCQCADRQTWLLSGSASVLFVCFSVIDQGLIQLQ